MKIHVDHSKPSPARAIIRAWMENATATLAAHDAKGHLELISKQVKGVRRA